LNIEFFMAHVLVIGSACKDIFFPTNEGDIFDTPQDATSQRKIAFELGAKYHIERRFETLGGCAVNVGVGLVKLGHDVCCHAPIGHDATGEWIVKNMADLGVDVSRVVHESKEQSDLSAIVVDKKSGERTIFSSHGASRTFSFDAGATHGADWLFIGDLSGKWKENLEEIGNCAKRDDIKIAFNPRQQMIHEDARFVKDMLGISDVGILNKDEALEIAMRCGRANVDFEIEDEISILRFLQEEGAEILVITDGVRGAWASDGISFLHAEALCHDEVIDTTGAGDAFASGFLGAIIAGLDISKALSWGIVNSSESLRYYGGQEGLLNSAEIVEKSSKVRIKKLK